MRKLALMRECGEKLKKDRDKWRSPNEGYPRGRCDRNRGDNAVALHATIILLCAKFSWSRYAPDPRPPLIPSGRLTAATRGGGRISRGPGKARRRCRGARRPSAAHRSARRHRLEYHPADTSSRPVLEPRRDHRRWLARLQIERKDLRAKNLNALLPSGWCRTRSRRIVGSLNRRQFPPGDDLSHLPPAAASAPLR